MAAPDKNTADTPAVTPLDVEGVPGATAQLGQVDGGWQAWTYLAAATGVETLVWGFANSYGVYLDYYTPRFPSPALSAIGTVSTGAMYLLLPFVTVYLSARPRLRPASMWAGLALLFASLVGAAFARGAGELVLTQGILYGIGGTLLYCPCTTYMFEWWARRRGFATGIMFSGTGAGGLVMPLVSQALLSRYGQRVTLVAIAIAYSVLLAALVPFVRPRLPVPKRTTRPLAPSWSFTRRSAFWLLWLGVLCQGLAAFIPATYLPSYATALSLPVSSGTLSVSLLSLARVPAQLVLGHLSDVLPTRPLVLALAASSAAAVFLGWGLAVDTPGVLCFALVFGACAGSYTALFPRFISAVVAGEERARARAKRATRAEAGDGRTTATGPAEAEAADTAAAAADPALPSLLYALFSFARGIGSVASGPVSSALLRTHVDASRGYGVHGYGAVILWTGVALLGSGVGAVHGRRRPALPA
ncbi:hypothetical protein Q5752_001672 [Cryptotrichosporon argae]